MGEFSSISDFIYSNIEDKSVLFLLISAMLSGYVGGSSKLLFETILSGKYKNRIESKKLLTKYRIPLAQAADSLKARLANLTYSSAEEWYKTSSYYKYSTLYTFCCYFAWLEILYRELIKVQFDDYSAARKLNTSVDLIHKTLNNFAYFTPLPKRYRNSYVTELPKYVCKALGEMCVIEKEGKDPQCIGFYEFERLFRNNSDFREACNVLDQFIKNIKKDYGNLNWDRLHLIELSLMTLTSQLDPKSIITKRVVKKDVQRIYENIYHSGAREIFYRDLIVSDLYLPVLGARDFFLRRVFLKFRYWDKIVPSKVGDGDAVLTYSCNEICLKDGKNRYKFYEKINKYCLDRLKKLPFGTQFTVIIDLCGQEIDADVVERIPSNIKRFTNGKVKEVVIAE